MENFLQKILNKLFKINRRYKNKLINISYDHIWCDDIESYYYNKLLKKSKLSKTNIGSFENLYRNDDAYDIIIEINQIISQLLKIKVVQFFFIVVFLTSGQLKGVSL